MPLVGPPFAPVNSDPGKELLHAPAMATHAAEGRRPRLLDFELAGTRLRALFRQPSAIADAKLGPLRRPKYRSRAPGTASASLLRRAISPRQLRSVASSALPDFPSAAP